MGNGADPKNHVLFGHVVTMRDDGWNCSCGVELRDFTGKASEICSPAGIESNDLVNHPSHYNNHPSGVECIQITRHMNFNLGNAMKYIWRAGIKDKDRLIEDLEKAKFYLQDEIDRLRGDI